MKKPFWMTVFCVAGVLGVSLPVQAEPEKDGKTLTEWRKQLKTAKDYKDRAKAAEIIGEIGEEARGAIDDLLATLNDKDWTVRQMTVEAIGRIGETLKGEGPEVKKAFPVLLAALKNNKAPDYEDNVRIELIRALPRMSSKDPAIAKTLVVTLLPYFKDKNKYVRGNVVEDLCRYLEDTQLDEQKKAVSPEAAKLLRDPEDYVRDRAKNSLPRIDPATAKKLGIK